MTEVGSTDALDRFDLERATEGSHVLALLRRASSPLTAASWLTNATRHSFLYRWLTAEPEPEVMVIDLRDTYTVGPVLALLDRLVHSLLPAFHRSRFVGIASTTGGAVVDAPVRAASLVVLVTVLVNLALAIIVVDPTRFGVIAHVVVLALSTLGSRVTMPWAELVRTRPIRLLVAAFEPPEDRNE